MIAIWTAALRASSTTPAVVLGIRYAKKKGDEISGRGRLSAALRCYPGFNSRKLTSAQFEKDLLGVLEGCDDGGT